MNSAVQQRFEEDVHAFYDRLREVRVAPPRQTLQNIDFLLQGVSSRADSELEHLWQNIVSNPCFERECVHFFNRCCYILINHWSIQPNVRGIGEDLVHLLRRVAAQRGNHSLPWSFALETFFESPQFRTLEEIIKVERCTVASSDYSQHSLRGLIHHYPCLYTSYFTRFNTTEEGRRSVEIMQRKRERQFETQLMDHIRQLDHSGSREDRVTSTENPTLLSHKRLKTALYEFAGTAQFSQDYHRVAEGYTHNIQQARSNRLMKEAIHHYLVDGLTAYSRCSKNSFSSSSDRFGRWLNNQLQEIRVELDGRPPNTTSVVRTCSSLLGFILASPKDINGLSNHTRFIDLVSNLGATYTVGLVLKLILLCRHPETNMIALRGAVGNRFVRLFEHYEQSPAQEDVSSVSWLLECMDNYMVASAIHFGSISPSAWKSVLDG